VEEITARTGNYKKFAVFARMLLAALRRDCDAVSADLLAFADLEALRARRAAPQGPDPHAAARGASARPAADAAAGRRGRRRRRRRRRGRAGRGAGRQQQALPDHDVRGRVRPRALPAAARIRGAAGP